MEDEWLVAVTDDDVRAARRAWVAAQRHGAPATRVAELHRGYERLVRTQARQFAESVRRPSPEDRPDTGTGSPGPRVRKAPAGGTS